MIVQKYNDLTSLTMNLPDPSNFMHATQVSQPHHPAPQLNVGVFGLIMLLRLWKKLRYWFSPELNLDLLVLWS